MSEAQCKRLKKHKTALQQLIMAKSIKKKRELLTLPLLNTLLSIILHVSDVMGLDM